MPRPAPYAAPTSEPLRDWLYFAAPPCRTMLNSLSAIAAAGAIRAAAARATRSFFMTFLLTGNEHMEIPRAVARGGRHGGDAEGKRPACPFAGRASVGPLKLELQKDLARHLRAGHPWVYKRAIERPPGGVAPGAIVDVTSGGKFVARGYYDPAGAVRVRVLTRDPSEALGPLFWRRRIARAVALRRAYVLSEETDCARLVHGEGDGLPGVVIDLYGRFAVLKLYSAGLAPHRGAILDALRGEVALDGIYGRDEEIARADAEDELSDRESRPGKGQALWGAEPPDEIIVREHGM